MLKYTGSSVQIQQPHPCVIPWHLHLLHLHERQEEKGIPFMGAADFFLQGCFFRFIPQCKAQGKLLH